MQKSFITLSLVLMMIGLIILNNTSTAQARGRYGSMRIGGYTSHGKGSHYIGGYVRHTPIRHYRTR